MNNQNDRKKVLFIAPVPFFAERGTPFNVRAVAEFLGQLGYDVDLLVYPLGIDINIPNVNIIRGWAIPGITEVPIGPSWPKFFLDILLSIKTIGLGLLKRYDLIHGVEEGGWMGGVAAMLSRKPFIIDMDSCMITQIQKSGFIQNKFLIDCLSKAESFFIKRASGVLTVCESLTKKAQAIVTSIPVYQLEDFPVDSSNQVDPSYVEKLRDEFNIRGKRVLGYTGNLQSYQGVDLLIDAFAEYKRCTAEASDVVLLLVGGEGKEDPLIAHYRNEVAKMGMSDSIILTGPRPVSEMGNIMALADALASPRSEGENTPLKIYSYMASARPVIATRLYTHTQVLTDDVAFLAEPTTSGFAGQIARCFARGKEEERKQIGQAAKDLVERRYSAQSFKRRLGELYQEVLKEKV